MKKNPYLHSNMTKLIKTILLIVLTALFAVMLYVFLHSRYTGYFSLVFTEHVILPLRHWLAISAATIMFGGTFFLFFFKPQLPQIARKSAIVVFVFAVLFASSFLLSTMPTSIVFPGASVIAARVTVENNINLTLSFSKTDHFYTESISVEIAASNPNARVFFTTDGSTPTVYSCEYFYPIYFEMGEELYVVVLRAVAVLDDFTTDPLTHTYFIGEEIRQRFGEDILVFSLSTNPEYLFDHDIGILVEGRIREEWHRDNPGHGARVPDPANFNLRGREGERPIHVETFTPCGGRALTQAAGVRVHGGWSRAHPQKSLRLIARRDYSPEAGRFQFDLFPDKTATDGTPMISIDTLILRNGGNSFDTCMLRNELGYTLARKAGLAASPVQAAAVFLNGEYYGFSWLQVRINDQYLEDAFNAPTREFDIVSGGEGWVRVGHRNIDEQAISSVEYKNSFAHKNLQDDYIFAELETIVDIDNLLLYYAFRIYWNYCDWPGNDMRRWRYTGEQTPGLALELDGRWRYRVNDLDFGLGMYHSSGGRLFHYMLTGDDPRSPFLINILTRPDMADRFTMILCDLAANVINGQTVSEGIDALFNECVWNEISHWAARWDMDVGVIEYHHRRMIDTATHRHEYIFESLSEYFGFGMEMYSVQIAGGCAKIGTQFGTSSRYFNHLIVPVSPVLPEFYKFDHWVLNGEQIYNADIMVSLDDAVADAYGNYAVELELVTRFVMPPLVIAELYEIGIGNGMVLVNLTDEEVHTSGLFLSNDSGNLQRWALPAMTVAPGESLSLAGRGSRTPEHLYWIQMDFNVREGRKFWLSDIDGNIIDSFSLRSTEQTVRDLSDLMYDGSKCDE